MTTITSHILVCGGTGCNSLESARLVERFREAVTTLGCGDETEVVRTGCFGFCGEGPIVKILPDNTVYVRVKPEDADEIVQSHILLGRKVEQLFYKGDGDQALSDKDMEFYKKQKRIALRHCGLIDPEQIEEYIGFEGYEALGKVLTSMTPEEVCTTVKDSGLRGRGGGGFPTGLKWEITNKIPSDQKYIICNADEGDPGAFMDRSILEGDPHCVLEAMAIGGYAIGASHGIIYIRAEYPLAIKRLEIAIAQARQYGLLGHSIFGTNFAFDIEIRYGAGAFVCGEETALIHSVEGKRGEPTKKPPFPSEAGYKGKPTCVNNVETFANIAPIILQGSAWYSAIGTATSKGTKVFALASKVQNVGLVEVPMGTTLREIIFDIGGGIRHHKKFKAVQTGGPSGGVITTADLDTPIDYESLKGIGSMMGSGGMIVMDEDDCMVNIAKFYLDFTQDESCGKCTPCRVGTKRMYEILDRITKGEGTLEDLDRLEQLGRMIKDTALCGLGQTAPNPVLSTMRFFREEYLAHIVDKRCPTGSCKELTKKTYAIDASKCIGCTACARACPVDCIDGKVKNVHVIDETICIACGACFTACRFDAVIKP